MIEEYQHSGKAPLVGVLLLALTSIIGGAIIGLIMFGVSQLISLVLIFPIVIAFVGFFFISRAVLRGKVRNSLITTIFGIILGLSIYGTYHLANYYRFSSLLFQSISASIPSEELIYIDRAATVSNLLEMITGSQGFLGYLKLNAMEGFSISHLYTSEGSGILLRGVAVYIYWLIEASIIVGVTAAGGRMAGSQPFCEDCQTWFTTLGQFGSVPAEKEELFIDLIRKDSLQAASELVANEGDALPPNLEVYPSTCQCDESGMALLEIKKTTRGRDNKVKRNDFLKFLIPYEARMDFDRRDQDDEPLQ